MRRRSDGTFAKRPGKRRRRRRTPAKSAFARKRARLRGRFVPLSAPERMRLELDDLEREQQRLRARIDDLRRRR